VFDPCAGWGGRLLGAMARDIDYTGIDTNTNLRDAYTELMKTFETKKQDRYDLGRCDEYGFLCD
jgi:hypothetical protein